MLCRRIGSSFARKTYILAILVILMAFTIGATLWTIVKLRDSKVLLPLLVLLLLMAVAEGALAHAVYRGITQELADSENQIPHLCTGNSTPSASVTTPTARSFRNFSLPRERCLDISPVIFARPLPIPPPYVATGILPSGSGSSRRLPKPPIKAKDTPKPSPDCQMYNDVVIAPLRIRKVRCTSVQHAEKPCIDRPKSESHAVQPSACKMSENTSFEFLSDDDTKLIASMTVKQAIHHETVEDNEKIDILPFDFAVADITRYHHPEHLSAPTIQIQPPTPTTPMPPPTSTSSYASTIRIVDPFLQVPEKIHHGSSRRKL